MFKPLSRSRGSVACRKHPSSRIVASPLLCLTGGLYDCFESISNRTRDIYENSMNLDSKETLKRLSGPKSVTIGADGFVVCEKDMLLAGRYRFVSIVSRGNNSQTVSCDDAFAHRRVVVKIPSIEHGLSTLNLFYILSTLQSKFKSLIYYTPVILDSFQIATRRGKILCLVFPPLYGSVVQLFPQQGAGEIPRGLALPVVCKIISQIVSIISIVSSVGVCVRDITPTRCMLVNHPQIRCGKLRTDDAHEDAHRRVSSRICLVGWESSNFDSMTFDMNVPQKHFASSRRLPSRRTNINYLPPEMVLAETKAMVLPQTGDSSSATSLLRLQLLRKQSIETPPPTVASMMWGVGVSGLELLSGRPLFDIGGSGGSSSSLKRADHVAELKAQMSNILGEGRCLTRIETFAAHLGSQNPVCLDFFLRCLEDDPAKRLSPTEALKHPMLAKSFPFVSLYASRDFSGRDDVSVRIPKLVYARTPIEDAKTDERGDRVDSRQQDKKPNVIRPSVSYPSTSSIFPPPLTPSGDQSSVVPSLIPGVSTSGVLFPSLSHNARFRGRKKRLKRPGPSVV